MNDTAFAAPLLSLRPRTADERLGWALAFAVGLHAAAILGVTFVVPHPPPAAPSLEVTLTQFREAAPKQADFVAPTHQTGSGDTASVRELTATRTSTFAADRERDVVAGAPAQAEAPRPIRDMNVQTETAAPRERDIDDLAERTPPGLQTAPLHLDVAREVATLQARIDTASQWQTRGPRVRRITSASAQSTPEAYYLNAWRRHVEVVGNVNYPSEARRLKQYGSLRVLVALGADGSLREVRVLESSGFPAIDAGALNIVRLAAPFPPFSAEMRQSIDVLEIVRTWQFKRVQAGEGFSADN